MTKMNTETSPGAEASISSDLLYGGCTHCNHQTLVKPDVEDVVSVDWSEYKMQCPKCREGVLEFQLATSMDQDLPMIHFEQLVRNAAGLGDGAEQVSAEVVNYLLSTRTIENIAFDSKSKGKVSFDKIFLEDGTTLHFSGGYVYKATYERSK